MGGGGYRKLKAFNSKSWERTTEQTQSNKKKTVLKGREEINKIKHIHVIDRKIK